MFKNDTNSTDKISLSREYVAKRWEGSFLKPKIQKYWSVLTTNIRNGTTYKANIFAQSFTVLFRIWIFTQLYTLTYQSVNSTQIGSLSLPMLIWSLMFAQTFQAVIRPPVAKIIEDEIKSGEIVYSLNRPYNYILFHFASYLGRALPKLGIGLIFGSVSCLILVGPILIQPKAIFFGLFVLFLGYILEFLMSFIIGMQAFKLEDISALIWIYHKFQLVLGGLILPITLFPDYLQKISNALPFTHLYFSGARLIVNFEFDLFFNIISVQIVWIAILLVISIFQFQKNSRYVSINGG